MKWRSRIHKHIFRDGILDPISNLEYRLRIYSTWFCNPCSSDIKWQFFTTNQKMTRVNTNILGISKLKRVGTGKFNSDENYIYYYQQESLRKNGVALLVNKRFGNAVWVQSQKWQNDFCSFPRQTIQYYSNPSQCLSHYCQRRSWTVLWWPTRPSRTKTKNKDVLFITGDWNAKVGSQEIPVVTDKFGLGIQN